MSELPREVKKAIQSRADSLAELLVWMIEHDWSVDTVESCEATIDATDPDDTLAIDLDLSDKFTLVAEYADDMGLTLEDVKFADLRTHLEGLASFIIDQEAQGEVRAALSKLEDLILEHDLDLSAGKEKNHLGWARHFAERSEGDGVQVYEYRNVEGSHVDVYEISLTKGCSLYLSKELEADEVSSEERVFDSV